mgnify:CR=1 FL=1
MWTNATRTPLERPEEYGKQQRLSSSQLHEQEEGAARNLANESPVRAGNPGAYNAFWRDPVRPTGQTSLIVDPPKGLLEPPEDEARPEQDEKNRRCGVVL